MKILFSTLKHRCDSISSLIAPYRFSVYDVYYKTTNGVDFHPFVGRLCVNVSDNIWRKVKNEDIIIDN